MQIHATSVELSGTGIVLLGAPGSGKSDLALRLIDAGARLIADDRTDLALESGRLIASAPTAIAGRIEARGVGILPVPSVACAPVGLAVELVASPAIERLPPARKSEWLGVAVPLVALDPFAASAVAKLKLCARAAACGRPFAA
ncbi:MAG: HPr kinase/phosphatase C-terminal domain-containing protein [Rhodospirillales bacterium]|nr:HPr kinase/phosphatase C-terminal domain-containing protein [Rhodospirillales bacterium]